MSIRKQFENAARSLGVMTKDQIEMVLEFHKLEGGSRHPVDVAVSLELLTVVKGQALKKALSRPEQVGSAALPRQPRAPSQAQPRLPRVPNATTQAQSKLPREVTPSPVKRTDPKGTAQHRRPTSRAPAAATSTQLSKGPSLLKSLVQGAIESRASDLHLHSNHPPLQRVRGDLQAVNASHLDADTLREELGMLLTSAHLATLKRDGGVNLCLTVSRGHRLRINVFNAQHGLSAIVRIIPPEVPALSQLNLPPSTRKLIEFNQGLVIVAGPASSGKSTTLASLIRVLNDTRSMHIVTIEDPIEHIHPSKRSSITQRQVGQHTESYATALKAVLREDPDVIIIGELHDRETMRTALTASETGHLVLGTLHTGTAETTIARVLDAFGAEEEMMRGTLAESLNGILVQRLVPSTSRGLVPVVEMMFNNSAISNCIRKRKLHQLSSLMQSGRAQGMITLEDSIQSLTKKNLIGSATAASLLEDFGRM